MPAFIDLTGKRFGMLTVISHAFVRKSKSGRPDHMWTCACDCGNETTVMGGNLRSGKTASCGCQLVKHGGKGTRLYSIWQAMKARCYKPSHVWYHRYGGRGITVCDEWLNNFAAFRDWAIANGYADTLTVDRIDNDKGYFPENCCWATQRQQIANRSNTIIFEFNGKKQNCQQWADEIGIPYGTLHHRLFVLKWSLEKALTMPKQRVNHKAKNI